MKDYEYYEDFSGGGEIDACDVCSRTYLHFGLCPYCCSMGSYSPGSTMCDTCEHVEVCAEVQK